MLLLTLLASLRTAAFPSGVRSRPRFVAKEMATDHWFDITATRRDLGYHPLVTVAAGVTELVAHYKAGNDH